MDRSQEVDQTGLDENWLSGELFCVGIKTAGLAPQADRVRHKDIANEIISKFASSPLRAAFATRSNTLWLGFDNIIGALCRGWLSDCAVDFCLEAIAWSIGQTLMLSALFGVVGWPTIPKTPILETNFTVHSVNLNANHWRLIRVRQYH